MSPLRGTVTAQTQALLKSCSPFSHVSLPPLSLLSRAWPHPHPTFCRKMVLVPLFQPGLIAHPRWGHFTLGLYPVPPASRPLTHLRAWPGERRRGILGQVSVQGADGPVATGVDQGAWDWTRGAAFRGTHLPCRLSLSPSLSPLVGPPLLLAQDQGLLLGPIIIANHSLLVSQPWCNNVRVMSGGGVPASHPQLLMGPPLGCCGALSPPHPPPRESFLTPRLVHNPPVVSITPSTKSRLWHLRIWLCSLSHPLFLLHPGTQFPKQVICSPFFALSTCSPTSPRVA